MEQQITAYSRGLKLSDQCEIKFVAAPPQVQLETIAGSIALEKFQKVFRLPRIIKRLRSMGVSMPASLLWLYSNPKESFMVVVDNSGLAVNDLMGFAFPLYDSSFFYQIVRKRQIFQLSNHLKVSESFKTFWSIVHKEEGPFVDCTLFPLIYDNNLVGLLSLYDTKGFTSLDYNQVNVITELKLNLGQFTANRMLMMSDIDHLAAAFERSYITLLGYRLLKEEEGKNYYALALWVPVTKLGELQIRQEFGVLTDLQSPNNWARAQENIAMSLQLRQTRVVLKDQGAVGALLANGAKLEHSQTQEQFERDYS